jgi:hypothetical protein
MIEVQTKGADDFYTYLQAIYQTGKRTMREQVQTHFRGVVRNMMALTYPMGSSEGASLKLNSKGQHTGAIDYAAGREAGRRAIASDLRRAFLTPHQASMIYKDSKRLKEYRENFKNYANESGAAALAWYLSMRNKRKRVRRSVLRPVTPANWQYVFREVQKRQGFVPAGWKEACSRLGVPLAAWISRMPAKGNCSIQEAADFYYLEARNSTQHPDAAALQKRAAIAMTMQRNNMKRLMLDFLKKTNKNKGFLT